MTSQQDPQSRLEATSLMARQVAESSKTLGLHIQQHDEISEEAQKRAGEVIAEARRLLEATHREMAADILDSIKSVTDVFRQDAERFLGALQQQGNENVAGLQETTAEIAKGNQDLAERLESSAKAISDSISNGSELLLKEHAAALEKAASGAWTLLKQQEELLRQEGQRQLGQYQELRGQTIGFMKTEMEGVLERASKANQQAFEQATSKSNQENKANTDNVVAAMNRRWSTFTKTIIGAAIISSVVAIAVTATLVTLT